MVPSDAPGPSTCATAPDFGDVSTSTTRPTIGSSSTSQWYSILCGLFWALDPASARCCSPSVRPSCGTRVFLRARSLAPTWSATFRGRRGSRAIPLGSCSLIAGFFRRRVLPARIALAEHHLVPLRLLLAGNWSTRPVRRPRLHPPATWSDGGLETCAPNPLMSLAAAAATGEYDLNPPTAGRTCPGCTCRRLTPPRRPAAELFSASTGGSGWGPGRRPEARPRSPSSRSR